MMSEIRQNPAQTHIPDRETLSALFDGELREDAARFAMRRLGHDADWRDACGRWQLLGDVLRGQASAQAPAGFAARVETALAAGRGADDDRATGTDGRVVPAARRWTRGRMSGAALAASVAFVALLAVRPGFDDTAPARSPEALTVAPAASEAATPLSPAPETAASRVASVPQAQPAPVPALDAGEPAPFQPASELGLAAAAVAVAELPRRARGQNNTRSQAQRAGLRSAREAQSPAQVVAAAGAGSRIAATATLPSTAEPGDLHPFLPPADEIPSRPWPSATLPEYPAAALTASYRPQGDPAGAGERTNSFYPFEPRLSDEQVDALLEAWRIEAAAAPREGPRR